MTLVIFPSLVDIDMLVLNAVSLNDPLNFSNLTFGGGCPAPMQLNEIFLPSSMCSVLSTNGSIISAASVIKFLQYKYTL